MAFSHEEGNIDRAERDLYSRNAPPRTEPPRSTFTPHSYNVSNEPKQDPFSNALKRELEPEEHIPKQPWGFFKKFFIGSIIFFSLAVILFVYMSFGGFNTVSSKNVDISVRGPVAVGGGEELILDIIVTNNNSVSLEGAELSIEYPSGTREASDLNIELVRQKVSIGDIGEKESVTKTVKAVLFGEKNSIKNIKVTIDYKAKGANAKFSKEKNYEIAIKSSPILLSVEYPKEVNSNQPMDFKVTVVSNSNTVTQNVLLRIDYPFGFSFNNATPKPSFDNNVWSIGDLNPKEIRTISIAGKMEGQNDEEKTFRFTAGTSDLNDEKVVGVDFISIAESVAIRKPFFDIKLSLEGDSSKDPISSKIGQVIDGKLTWTNNLATSINDVVVEVTLSGNALNRDEVSASQQGFYQSVNNRITWDKRVFPKFSQVDPGQTGDLDFQFETLKPTSQVLAALRNPKVGLDVLITGIRFSETQPPEKISYAFSRELKVNTETIFNPRMIYSTGPFDNTGPIPPKAEKTTTYTVFWTISNSFNDIGNTTITAALPPNVKWVGTKSPLTEKIMYNEASNKVIWEPGEIKAGVGFTGSPREVAFQVSFLPSLGQVGDTPDIIEAMIFTALDRFTGKEITINKPALNTRISTDPEFNFGDDVVVK